ncbi:hypothetical protein [Hyphococcus sp.]|uniref:hypothetical protein n=1 Tax=Hyphococcus sp. TaxID=2038636 RepID=UPI003CCB87AC
MNIFSRKVTGIAVLLPLLMQSEAHAQATAVVTPWATVQEIQTALYRTNEIFVKLNGIDPSLYNPGGCTQVSGFRKSNDRDYDIGFEMLLQATATGREVRLNIQGCHGMRPEIIGVQIR